MSNPEWGVKRNCQSCQAVFYDMKKDPITCPKCKAVYDTKAYLKANPIDGAFKEEKDIKDPSERRHEDRDEDEVFLDRQDDFLESLEDLDDKYEPGDFIPHNM